MSDGAGERGGAGRDATVDALVDRVCDPGLSARERVEAAGRLPRADAVRTLLPWPDLLLQGAFSGWIEAGLEDALMDAAGAEDGGLLRTRMQASILHGLLAGQRPDIGTERGQRLLDQLRDATGQVAALTSTVSADWDALPRWLLDAMIECGAAAARVRILDEATLDDARWRVCLRSAASARPAAALERAEYQSHRLDRATVARMLEVLPADLRGRALALLAPSRRGRSGR